MLRVVLDIVPFGIESNTRHISTLEIARTTMRENPENYRVYVYAQDGELVNIYTVKQHAYYDGAWALTNRALDILLDPECY